MRVSHEAIYQALYIQGRGALRRELAACLRTGRALQVPRARIRQRGMHFITPELLISERAPEVIDRAVPGHWEGDLIIGVNSSAIGTLVERTTRFKMQGFAQRTHGKSGLICFHEPVDVIDVFSLFPANQAVAFASMSLSIWT